MKPNQFETVIKKTADTAGGLRKYTECAQGIAYAYYTARIDGSYAMTLRAMSANETLQFMKHVMRVSDGSTQADYMRAVKILRIEYVDDEISAMLRAL